MAKQLKTSDIQDLRKGIVIFVILLAIIIAVGVYLLNQAKSLHDQYDHIEQTVFKSD